MAAWPTVHSHAAPIATESHIVRLPHPSNRARVAEASVHMAANPSVQLHAIPVPAAPAASGSPATRVAHPPNRPPMLRRMTKRINSKSSSPLRSVSPPTAEPGGSGVARDRGNQTTGLTKALNRFRKRGRVWNGTDSANIHTEEMKKKERRYPWAVDEQTGRSVPVSTVRNEDRDSRGAVGGASGIANERAQKPNVDSSTLTRREIKKERWYPCGVDERTGGIVPPNRVRNGKREMRVVAGSGAMVSKVDLNVPTPVKNKQSRANAEGAESKGVEKSEALSDLGLLSSLSSPSSSPAPAFAPSSPPSSFSDAGASTSTVTPKALEQPPSSTGSFATEPRVAALLASAREANGSLARGTESIWAALKQPFVPSKDKGKGKAKEGKASGTPSAGVDSSVASDTRENDSEEIEGATDIMLYSPLIPQCDSLVEVAMSEVVTLYEDEGERLCRAELRRRWADGRGFIPLDSMSTIQCLEKGEEKEAEEKKAEEKCEENVEKKLKLKEKVVWVPSTTQISVQVLWWGYRMYLPPPVLMVLNHKSLEAAKRAALITASLRWLLDNLPMTLLPPPLRPVALLLQCLVPLLGAIGTFIAWSWSAIGTFDKGHGVVLSATWLLPVVLIPGTWEENEVPRPSPSPDPSPSSNSSTLVERESAPIAGPSQSRRA